MHGCCPCAAAGVVTGAQVASAAAAAPVACEPTVVLVKVGDGEYSTFKRAPYAADVLGQDRMGLLRALEKDDAFKVSMKDVAFDKCTVAVVTRVAQQKPTVEEEAAGAPVELDATVGTVAAGRATGARLFICVKLPRTGSAVAGER